jgi:glycosyltransferase involved in cell wall biosynthesis
VNYERRDKLVQEPHLPNQSEVPLVSVCIPAYNAESTLGETLDSILAQDYPNLDIVVSDNRSTDGTKAIAKRYAERGVRYCLRTEGRPLWAKSMPNYIGGYANWDFVLSQGHGEYLCLFHSDDLYEPSIVRQQVEVMQAHPNVGVVFTGRRLIGEDGYPIQMGTFLIPDDVREHATLDFPTLLNSLLKYSNFLSTPSVMFRRSAIENTGNFDERHFLTSADLDMWLKIAHRGNEIAIINQPLLKYRISQRQGGEQYHKLRVTQADFFSVLDYYLNLPGVRAVAQQQTLAFYEMQRAADLILCAMNLLTQGRTSEARAILDQSIRLKHFIAALKLFKRPRLFVRMVVGLCFWVSVHLGFGTLAGRLVYDNFQRTWQRRRKSVKKLN